MKPIDPATTTGPYVLINEDEARVIDELLFFKSGHAYLSDDDTALIRKLAKTFPHIPYERLYRP